MPAADFGSRWGSERLGRWLGLLSRPPYSYTQSYAVPLLREITELLSAQQFDCLVAETGAIAHVLAPVAREFPVVSVADLFDVDSIMLERSLRLEVLSRHPYDVAKRKVPLHKLRSAERAIMKSFTCCVATSEHDATILEDIGRGIGKPIVIPNGVDTDYYRPLHSVPLQPNTLVFTGYMVHGPNVDGVLFFCRDILPIIRTHRPSIRLLIVGADPTPEVRELDEGDGGAVRVLGQVPDTRPYLAQSSVTVVPLRFGSGTRLKVLEALAMEKPTVSTTLGVEGLDAVHERHLLVADSPVDFAGSVLRLLDSPREGEKLGASGRDLVESRYQWQSISATFRSELRDLVARAHGLSGLSYQTSGSPDWPNTGRV
jgi:glycosyltransferase involved in cell wall biosynthesis